MDQRVRIIGQVTLERGPLLADETLTGARWCRVHAGLIDAWLTELLVDATRGATEGVALVAVGGYGRAEVSPQSDIDVYLVHNRADAADVANRVWYPIWDEALHLGHSVCTVKEALRLAADDLTTATALLSVRHVAGDARLTEELAAGAIDGWERRSKKWLTELGAGVALRHEKVGEVAFVLEPDLKEGRGGMRDAHALGWARAAHRTLLDHDEAALGAAYGVLLDARVELQRRTGRASNVLALQDQDDVAAALGDRDADSLMARVAQAARTIAWTSDDTWRRIQSARRGPLGRARRRNRAVNDDVRLHDGEIAFHADADIDDPTVALRAAVAAAAHNTVIDRESLERLAAATTPMPITWSAERRQLFVELLQAGRPAVSVIEALDQRGVWARFVPEWEWVRARPQRNPYHRYTVDRHLLETVAGAAALARRVSRPDLLVMGALLHDIGKGRAGDHTDVGVELARQITARMDFASDDADTIVALVQHHLLLPDVATRRDLDDPTTIERVATSVGSAERLGLLAALTQADGLATGPSAWGLWKAQLVDQLVDRVATLLSGGPYGAVDQFPGATDLARLVAGEEVIEVLGHTLTVMTADRPGVFSRVAGVLALHGLDVLGAAAHSTDDGRALAQFRVHDPVREYPPWDRVTADLRLALDGQLALAARLADRARTYSRHRRVATATPRVTFDTEASDRATVIDVQTTDGIGVLYRITRALADHDLDIRSARVQTLGTSVVDAFYVLDGRGAKIVDRRVFEEIDRAILHSLGS